MTRPADALNEALDDLQRRWLLEAERVGGKMGACLESVAQQLAACRHAALVALRAGSGDSEPGAFPTRDAMRATLAQALNGERISAADAWIILQGWDTLAAAPAASAHDETLREAASRVAQTARHHEDCEPLSPDGCKCGLWELQTAVVDTALAARSGSTETTT